MIGDAILADIEKELKRACSKHGLEYQKNVRIPKLDRAVSFVLESLPSRSLSLMFLIVLLHQVVKEAKKKLRGKRKLLSKRNVMLETISSSLIFWMALDGLVDKLI